MITHPMTIDLPVSISPTLAALFDNVFPFPLSYADDGASGLDLRAKNFMTVQAQRWASIPTGVAIALPPGFEAQVRGRSGLAARNGILVHVGTIDQSYRGEIIVIAFNFGSSDWYIDAGDRIAQLVIAPVVRATLVPVPSLSETTRGTNGLGSTGIE